MHRTEEEERCRDAQNRRGREVEGYTEQKRKRKRGVGMHRTEEEERCRDAQNRRGREVESMEGCTEQKMREYRWRRDG
jgi:hypothetical protein